ncbi:MAG: Ig-like domain-containing protein [Bacteroidota bacterium]
MKHIFNLSSAAFLILSVLILMSCSRRDFDTLSPASFPTDPDVFLDAFTAGLNYAAFGGSDVTAFQVDMEVKYEGESSMRFAVPDAGSPRGAYAGGVFFLDVGRDLTGYDALTFWAKASKSASVDLIGFGNDLQESKFLAQLNGVAMNTNWQKYIIPIPDPAKLTEEKGMLFFSEGPEDSKGYTFWIDEVKFEKLGTIAQRRPIILAGQDQTTSAGTGETLTMGGFSAAFNMPTGIDDTVNTAAAYFDFVSSDNSIATVNETGIVTILDAGTATITATLAGEDAVGSLTVSSTGEVVKPQSPAPMPTRSADSVISMFSNAYDDVPIDLWNTFWQFSTALNEDIQIDGDDVKRYKNLNFVGIEFTSQQINASEMTHFHMDIWTPDPTDLPAVFKVLLVDFGADGSFDGGDDSSHELSFTSPVLKTGEWISLDMPFSSFTGLTNRNNLAQLVLSGDLPNVFIDNVYFYQDANGSGTGGGTPTSAAPTPTANPADVISIFSDAYTDQAGTNFNPDWGQATTFSEVSVDGNAALLYAGLNYQGTELAGGLDVSGMTHLHIDYWTANSTLLNAFIISSGPVETAKSLDVPTSGWNSIDIPLTDFNPVDLMDVIQFKFDGNGDIYLDNIYFVNDPSLGGGSGSTGPSAAAPTPAYPAADVISIFSDAYTNVAGTNLNPDWGQATTVSQPPIDGNTTLLYKGLNYQGTELSSAIDVSGMGFLHLDFWTENSTALEVFLISDGPVETPFTLTVPTTGWVSVDIPLSNFSPVDLAAVFQMKFEGDGDIYLDNILFRK